MAYGTAVKPPYGMTQAQPVTPVSMLCDWVTVASTINSAEAAPTKPESANSTRLPLFNERNQGTIVCIRVKYARASTVTTNPVVRVFGRVKTRAADGTLTVGDWMALYNLADTPTITATITCDTTNDTDNDTTWKWSSPSRKDQCFDAMGCNEILVVVSTAIAGSAVTTATLEAKWF